MFSEETMFPELQCYELLMEDCSGM